MPELELPASVQRSELPDGVRYVLPKPPLGAARWLALPMVLFSCVFVGFALFWMVGASGLLRDNSGGFEPGGLFFVLFGVPFVVAGMVPALVGLTLVWGRSEVRVSGGQLQATDRLGPLRWTRRRPIIAIQRLELFDAASLQPRGHASSSSVPAGLRKVAVLRADGKAMRPMTVAWGHDPELMRSLAQELAERCAADATTAELLGGGGDPLAEEISGIEVVQHTAGGVARSIDEHGQVSETEAVPDQPAESDAQLQWNEAGFTLTIPPAGIWKGSRGLVPFGIIWTLFTGGIGTAMLFGADVDETLFLVLFLLAFLAIGITMFIAGLNMGRRRAIIDVVGDTLLISRQSIFGTKQHEWPRDQIAAIRVDHSGLEVNKRPVMNLQIHPHEGKRLGILSQRTDDELEWIAALLRTTLDVPAHARETTAV